MMSPELVAAAAKLIGVLILIVGALMAFNVYSRKFLRTGLGNGTKAVHVLETTPLGLKKTVSLVKVPGAVLVVGVTNDRISLLERIAEGDYEAFRESAASPTPPSFQDHLRRFAAIKRMNRFKTDGAAASESTPC
jgi:flagellar biogenesis protein FliO